MADSVLSLQEFGVAFGDRIILSSVTLDIPEAGIFNLMGPGGTGKSTLLRTLCGFTQANPANRVWGRAVYAGEDLFQHGVYPALVSQNARLMIASILENIVFGLPERQSLTIPQQRQLAQRLLEDAELHHLTHDLNTAVTELALADQRMLAILRQVAGNPRLLCIDEPTAGLEAEDSDRLVDYIRKVALQRAVLLVTHDKQLTARMGGYTALIAGGWIQEIQPTGDFINHPLTEVARTFLRTGSCNLPSPNAKPEHVADEFVKKLRQPPKEATEYKSHVLGPSGFMWLKKGRLAGTPRPGLLFDLPHDLQALKRVGVEFLVSLTKNPLDTAACQESGINVISSPIPDMHPPTVEQALYLCRQIDELMRRGKVVAVHCRAGLGRTGTLLASQLIYEGESALSALEKVRSIEPRWVQSENQIEFLKQFERYVLKELIPDSSAEVVNAGAGTGAG